MKTTHLEKWYAAKALPTLEKILKVAKMYKEDYKGNDSYCSEDFLIMAWEFVDESFVDVDLTTEQYQELLNQI